MNYEKIKTEMRTLMDELLPKIASALNEVFHKSLTISVIHSEEMDMKSLLNSAEFPEAVIHFILRNEDVQSGNLILLPAEFIVKLIGADEASETTVPAEIGKIKSQLPAVIKGIKKSTGYDFELNDLGVSALQSPEQMKSMLPARQGFVLNYQCAFQDGSVQVTHCLWLDEEDGKQESQGRLNDSEAAPPNQASEKIDVQSAEFESLADDNGTLTAHQNLDMLMNVKLDVTVELGKKTLMIADVLKLGKGSVVELDSITGEPLAILVNGTIIAEGEVVVIDDHFGIRITNLLSPKERVKSLG